jgi:hypothetical protein
MFLKKINLILSTALLSATTLSATQDLPLSAEFAEYHLMVAANEVQDDYIFYLLEQNIKNLDNASTCDDSMNELFNLLDEGYVIDPFNMSRLIGLVDHANPCNNATKVILKAMVCKSPITADHISSLIVLLDHANPRNNVTKILLQAITFKIPLNEKHVAALIAFLGNANPSDSATTILLKAIECGISFGPKERFLLAEASKIANARNNVEKIRKALHDKASK